ncbi:MAG: EscU/YscU/HrcU family type III secretion system export apparatus switch protein [Synergistaceae bacterium]|nr:EscU/YscU/HrcU family type III secretion system export apparatus switch protein [Synergistaceae bacterium]
MPRKKKDKAAALKYDVEKSPVPEVTASGYNDLARRIVSRAKEANVPVVEDVALVSALLSLEIGDAVPENLYGAVAKVLTFLYNLDKDEYISG